MPIFLKLFQKTEEEGTIPNPFYKATITLISKPGKDNTQKESYRPISLMNREAKSPKRKKKKNILANRIQPYIRKLMHHDQVRFILGYKNSSIYGNQSK